MQGLGFLTFVGVHVGCLRNCALNFVREQEFDELLCPFGVLCTLEHAGIFNLAEAGVGDDTGRTFGSCIIDRIGGRGTVGHHHGVAALTFTGAVVNVECL